MLRLAMLALAVTAGVKGLTIPPIPNVNGNGDLVAGVLSGGYFIAPHGSAFTQASTAMIVTGQMTSVILNSGATMSMDDQSVISIGSYSLFTLDSNCKFSMDHQANFVRASSTDPDGRSEFYCNEAFSLGVESFISMQPQSLIYTNAPFTVGQSIYINLKQGAVLLVNHTVVIQDYAVMNIQEQARLEVLTTATGVVAITSSTAVPPNPTTVTLLPSAKIINEGAMTIGGGQATKVNVMSSGLLQIGPQGSFSIASSTFDIGPSSFWIINGTFSFDDGSTLSSGLQSNITVGPSATFKTLTGGNVTVGAGGSLQLVGASSITGTFALASSAHVSITGLFTMTDASAVFSLNYASTAEIVGKLAINQGGSVVVGSSSGLNIGSYASVTIGASFTMGERSYVEFAFTTPIRCISFTPITVNAYTPTIITTKQQANALGFFCG